MMQLVVRNQRKILVRAPGGTQRPAPGPIMDLTQVQSLTHLYTILTAKKPLSNAFS